MSSSCLVSRGNSYILNVINTWRKVATAASTTTTATATVTLNSRYNLKQINNRHRQMSTYQSFRAMDSPPGVFGGLTDRFGGVTIDGQQESNLSPKDFEHKLQKSLKFWQEQKKRALWFRVHKEQAAWVPILAASGFDFHHARTGVVIMYRWLPTDESANLPHYAHTLIGVGGLVINEETQEVLVVSDRHALITNMWKLPGGYVEPNENLVDAAIREVEEETGIRTSFRSMISLRHSHHGNFDCSDIYIVMGLKPLNMDLKRCNREIERVRWMPLEQYFRDPQVLDGNRKLARIYLDNRERGINITCKNIYHDVLKKNYHLYYVDKPHTKGDENNDDVDDNHDHVHHKEHKVPNQ